MLQVTRKTISFLLVLVLCVSFLLPSALAFAEELSAAPAVTDDVEGDINADGAVGGEENGDAAADGTQTGEAVEGEAAQAAQDQTSDAETNGETDGENAEGVTESAESADGTTDGENTEGIQINEDGDVSEAGDDTESGETDAENAEDAQAGEDGAQAADGEAGDASADGENAEGEVGAEPAADGQQTGEQAETAVPAEQGEIVPAVPVTVAAPAVQKSLIAAAANGVYNYEQSGKYADVSISGTYKGKQIPSAYQTVIRDDGSRRFIEGWAVDDMKNNTKLTATVTITDVPELQSGERIAVYSVADDSFSALIADDVEVGDSISLSLKAKGENGIAIAAVSGYADILADDAVVWANDDLYLTGKLPANAVVDATPVEIEIGGEDVIAAYDIKIYANEKQREKGKTWQPADDKVEVHFYEEAAGDGKVNIYHFSTGETEPEYVDTVEAEDGWVNFEAESFSIYSLSTVSLIQRIVNAAFGSNKLYENDDIVLTGSMPLLGVVDAKPVKVKVAGEKVLLAYDIKIYANSLMKLLGVQWQPEEGAIQVRFKSDVLADSERELNIYHLADGADKPEFVASVTAEDSSVTFDAESFSTYIVSETTITKTVTTSDGATYEVSVTYPETAGIPMEGTTLLVSEIRAEDEGYDSYVSRSADKVGVDVRDLELSAVFDIKICDENDPGTVYEPTGDVSVSIRLIGQTLDAYGSVDVVHFIENSKGVVVSVKDISPTVGGEDVSFTTDSFSVYVVVAHEGGAIVTPRVEFHFISPVAENVQATVENNTAYYTSELYSFNNKAGNTQTSMIVRSGDTLESIEAPMNTETTYFYGWYTVDYDSTTQGGVKYSWPDGTKRVELDRIVTISEVAYDGSGAVTSLKWTVDGASQTVTENIDADGCAHVYLAPIYNNYYFVNFHLGAVGETTASTIMARKLIVLGNSQQTDIRIGDIKAPSNDPIHVIFIGWEHNTGTEQDPVWTLERTIGDNNEEIQQPGKDGTYITTGAVNVDLYPRFVQARWINFNLGNGGNGSAYLGPQFMYTSDDVDGDEYARTDFATTTRTGYRFDGWYVNACMINNEIMNLNGPYSHTTTVEGNPVTTNYTQAIKITNADGSVVTGTTIKGYANAQGEIVYIETPGYELAFEVKDGKMYVYNALSELPFYAKWTPNAEATYKVIIWKQKVTDDKDTVNTPIDLAQWLAANPGQNEAAYVAANGPVKQYDYFTYFERTTNDTSVNVSPTASDLGYATSNPNGAFTGFELGAYDYDKQVDPQGSTVLNVYYDRIKYTLTFQDYIYSTGNGNYGLQDGVYVLLKQSGGNYYYLATASGAPVGADATVYTWNGTGTTNPNYGTTYYGNTGRQNQLTWTRYTGTRYTRTNSRQTVKTIEALTGQDVSSYFPIVADNGFTYNHGERWAPQNSATFSEVVVIINNIPEENVTFYLDNAVRETKTIYYYVEVIPGETPTLTTGGVDYKLYGNPLNVNVNFFTAEDNVEIQGFTKNGSDPAFDNNGRIQNASSVNFYYTRDKYLLTFSANYPSAYSVNEPNARMVSNIPYQAIVSDYLSDGDTAAFAVPSTDYQFGGWYEDASGTVPYNFDDPNGMQNNKIIYAKWELKKYRIRINPMGGVIDHINYTLYGSDLTATGLNGTLHNNYATFFNNTATQLIDPYNDLKRPYVEVSDAEAAQMAEGTVYRYVNMQFFFDRYGSYSADARNALYIKDTEESIAAYYNYYREVIEDQQDGTPLPRSLWESEYLSDARYRELRAGEQYVQLGWYEVDESGNRVSNSYFDFSQPVDHATTLCCDWRLDGGYSLLYTTEYYAPNNDYITANMEYWTDPIDGVSKYADQASTQAMQEPTAIVVNYQASDEYQFRGWQIVRMETVAGRPRYTALEPGVYYTAGQPLTVQAKYSDSNMIIHMQAVYEKRTEAYRRPDVINLTLDASRDASSVGTGSVDPTNGSWPAWTYPGHYYSDDTHIYFGDTQSNTAVHLYKYATWLTESEVTGATLSPAGVNFFEHSAGYKLIGFDLDAADTDYVPDFAADSVVAVSPGTNHTLYAVWEPMVYLDLVNETEQTLTVRLTSTDGNALYIVNQANGSFSREPVDPDNITLVPGTTRLVMPYGAGKDFTIYGTNTLGTGWVMEVGSTYAGRDASQDPAPVTGIKNNTNYHISDRFYEDAQGRAVRVVFTAQKSPRTLVLHDNDTVDATWEATFGADELSYTLTETRVRVGRLFKGWDEDPDATSATYPVNANGTMSQTLTLGTFFQDGNGDPLEVKHLYAVWGSSDDEGVVKVYKEVPTPGDQSKSFTFRVRIQGRYRRNNWYGYTTVNEYSDFTLSHGQYLRIAMDTNTGGSGTQARLRVNVQKYNADGTTNGAAVDVGWLNNNNNSYNTVELTDGVTVTETTDVHYVTSTEIVGLYNNSFQITPAGTTDPNSEISWTNERTGGTAVFTNTRKTADVTINKTLLPANLDPELFSFTVAFTNGSDADTYESYDLTPTTFNIISGSAGRTISGIPTGAILQITENADSTRYTTAASGATNADDTALADADAADNIFRFTVAEDSTVSFTNTLKSQRVRIVVTDDSEPAVPLDSAMFTFPGVFEGSKYAAEGTGIVGDDSYEAFVGTYTLTETSMPNHLYQKLDNPVAVTVTSSGVTVPAGTQNVSVSGPDAGGVYTITVVNPKLMRVTVKKSVLGFDRTGTFGFTAVLTDSNGDPVQTETINPGTASARSTDANGRIEFTLVDNQTVILHAPKNTSITVTETEDPAYTTQVQTGADAGALGSPSAALTATLNDLTADKYVLFTNTYKTVDITVAKFAVGEGGTFDFTAQLSYKSNPVSGYTLNGTNSIVTGDGEGGTVAGQAQFSLTTSANGSASIVFTIPYGSELTLTEADDPDYIPSYEVKDDGDVTQASGSGLTVTLTSGQTVEDMTVNFTNTYILIAPTGFKFETQPYIWLWIAGLLIFVSVTLPLICKKRSEEEE